MTRRCKNPACGKPMVRKTVRRKGKKETESPSAFQRRKYCNRTCMAEGMRKPAEDLTRKALLQRARVHRASSCEECGATENLDIHHRDRNWRNNDPSNLGTLCHSCHMRLHHGAGDIVERKEKPPCRVCGKPSYRRALCNAHLTRWKRHGSPYLKKTWDGSSWTLTRVSE